MELKHCSSFVTCTADEVQCAPQAVVAVRLCSRCFCLLKMPHKSDCRDASHMQQSADTQPLLDAVSLKHLNSSLHLYMPAVAGHCTEGSYLCCLSQHSTAILHNALVRYSGDKSLLHTGELHTASGGVMHRSIHYHVKYNLSQAFTEGSGVFRSHAAGVPATRVAPKVVPQAQCIWLCLACYSGENCVKL
eukprot:15377-Heterococcus_DN1.PRE.3